MLPSWPWSKLSPSESKPASAASRGSRNESTSKESGMPSASVSQSTGSVVWLKISSPSPSPSPSLSASIGFVPPRQTPCVSSFQTGGLPWAYSWRFVHADSESPSPSSSQPSASLSRSASLTRGLRAWSRSQPSGIPSPSVSGSAGSSCRLASSPSARSSLSESASRTLMSPSPSVSSARVLERLYRSVQASYSALSSQPSLSLSLRLGRVPTS